MIKKIKRFFECKEETHIVSAADVIGICVKDTNIEFPKGQVEFVRQNDDEIPTLVKTNTNVIAKIFDLPYKSYTMDANKDGNVVVNLKLRSDWDTFLLRQRIIFKLMWGDVVNFFKGLSHQRQQ